MTAVATSPPIARGFPSAPHPCLRCPHPRCQQWLPMPNTTASNLFSSPTDPCHCHRTSSPVTQMEAAWEWPRAIQRSCAAYMEFIQICYDVTGKERDEVSATKGSGDVEGEIKGSDGVGATRGVGEGKGKVAVVSMGIKVGTC